MARANLWKPGIGNLQPQTVKQAEWRRDHGPKTKKKKKEKRKLLGNKTRTIYRHQFLGTQGDGNDKLLPPRDGPKPDVVGPPAKMKPSPKSAAAPKSGHQPVVPSTKPAPNKSAQKYFFEPPVAASEQAPWNFSREERRRFLKSGRKYTDALEILQQIRGDEPFHRRQVKGSQLSKGMRGFLEESGGGGAAVSGAAGGTGAAGGIGAAGSSGGAVVGGDLSPEDEQMLDAPFWELLVAYSTGALQKKPVEMVGAPAAAPLKTTSSSSKKSSGEEAADSQVGVGADQQNVGKRPREENNSAAPAQAGSSGRGSCSGEKDLSPADDEPAPKKRKGDPA